MAAYAALVSLGRTIEKIILNHDQYPISLHRKQQIIRLDKSVSFMQTFLKDFPEKANSLESRITDAANKAEDIIECFMWEQIRSRFRLIKCLAFPVRFKFKKQLARISKEIDSITGEAMEMKNSSATTKKMKLGDSAAAGSSSRLAPTGKMVGLHDDLIAIKSRLCGESSRLQVIPIVGMGGIGKTTLARNAYDDPLTVHYFDIRAWVRVSQVSSSHRILSDLLVSMKAPSEKIFGKNRIGLLAEEVYKNLKGKRYLIVMDDMWSTKAWNDVRNIFPNDNNGSRIMLTTRLLNVAAYPDRNSPLYEMRFMDEVQSWNLLRERVFADKDCPPELGDIGKTIAGSCKGLPLAIVVVAGLLSTLSKTRASWEKIAENVNSVVAAEQGQIGEILSLSYTHLPHHSRPCFLYLGFFPENYEIRASRLIKLWVAEGILERQNGDETLEEEAEECLEDLVTRSLVLVTKRRSNGKIKSCSLHDLMRDFCIRKAHESNFLLNLTGSYVEDGSPTKSIKDQRRLSIPSAGLTSLSSLYGSTIRTIMCFHSYNSLVSLECFRLLRVLDVAFVCLRSLPAQLFELFHLRYLVLDYDNLIPAAISKLQNLQTLIIRARSRKLILIGQATDRLPREIWRIPQLRHLLFYGWLPHPQGTTSTLENLQTLSLLPDYMCTEEVLKMVPNLRKLVIDCSQYGTYLNNLVHLHQLENLELHATSRTAVWRKDDVTLPRTLKKLTLTGFPLPWNEMTVVGSLPNLRVLKLRNSACRGRRWETTEGEFPQLEFLLIERLRLRHWVTESSHFPRLKFLLLHECRLLREIPNDVSDIATLELIDVKGPVRKSLVDSATRIKEEQQCLGCDALQVRCI